MIPKIRTLAAAVIVTGCATTPELATVDQIPELMDAFEVDGLAVAAVSGDEILIADGYGSLQNGDSYTSATSCGLYSATKVLASITYANAANEGLLDLDEPLGSMADYLPDHWAEIPFYRLLNHTSGITMAVNKPEFETLSANPDAENRDIFDLIKDAPLDYVPGEFSRYRQSGYAIAEILVQDELGGNFGTLVERYITEPYRMTDTFHPALQDEAQAALILSAGGYVTTADDMANLFLGLNNDIGIPATAWTDLLLTERYVFDDYSLGSVIQTRNDVLTVGHSGGGARANIRYAPDQKIGVMVCSDDTQNNWLAMTLANMLIEEIVTGKPPKKPLLVALAGFNEMTGDDVVAAYRTAARKEDQFDLSSTEPLLNMIGYEFLEQEKTGYAITVFELNTQLFPGSANTYDSLGEALLKNGDEQGALVQYEQALDLEPRDERLRDIVRNIRSEHVGQTPLSD